MASEETYHPHSFHERKTFVTKKIYPYEKPNPKLIMENLNYENIIEQEQSDSSNKSGQDNEENTAKSMKLKINDTLRTPDEIIDKIMKESNEDTPNKENKACFNRWFDKISGGSLRGSIFAVASVTFGGGCLAFPYAISLVGPVIGFFIFAISAFLSYLTAVYLIDTGIKTKTLDYNQLVSNSVGNKMRIFADINNIVLCIGVIMSYQYMVYEFIQIVLKNLFEIQPSDSHKLIIVLICCCSIQIPLSLLKNISVLQYASLTATVSLCYCIIVIVIESPYYFKQNYKTDPKYTLSITPPDGIGLAWLDTLSTFLFGFCSHNGLFQVFMEMDRPNLRRSMKVINRAMLVEITLYLLISYGGFFSFFYKSPDVILKRDDLVGFHDYFMLVAKIALIVVLNCCMAINYNIMRLSVRSMVFNNEIPSFWMDFGITVVVYAFSNTVTFFVKNAATILGFVGGISTVVISFACPILIIIKNGGYKKGSWKIYLNWVFFILMCIAGVACTIKAVYNYIHDLQSSK